MKILQDTLKEAVDHMDAGDLDDARFALGEVASTISEMISTYEDASRDVGFKLPYRGRAERGRVEAEVELLHRSNGRPRSASAHNRHGYPS